MKIGWLLHLAMICMSKDGAMVEEISIQTAQNIRGKNHCCYVFLNLIKIIIFPHQSLQHPRHKLEGISNRFQDNV